MKKFVSLLLALAMLVAMAPAAFAATIPEGGIQLTLGNNDLFAGEGYVAEVKEYYYVAEQTGTLYFTLRAYGYGDFNNLEELLETPEWAKLSINGQLVTAAEQTVEVTAGDLVNITLESVDADVYFAKIDLSYDGFYSDPAGSQWNPIVLDIDDLPTYTPEIPAGQELFYEFTIDFLFYGYVLHIYGDDAYIVVERYNPETDQEEPVTIYATDGVLTYDFEDGSDIKIGNAGDTAASFQLACEVPLGSQDNPYELTVGDQTFYVPDDYIGCYCRWIVPENGTMTIIVSGDSWAFDIFNQTQEDYAGRYSAEGDANYLSWEVNEGDIILLNLYTADADWIPVGGELTVTLEFTPSGESEEEDLSLHLENNYLKVREGWGAPVRKDYTYIAEASGTLYITFRSFGCFGNHWPESYLTDEFYLEGFSLLLNGQPVTVFKNTLEVTAGDEVVITIDSLDGYPYETNVWLSYEGFYEEPVGSELNPVAVYIEDLPTYTVNIPAGEALYYEFMGYDFYDYALYIYGENAYIIVNRYNYDTDETEPFYIYAVDGVVEYRFTDGLDIRIGNAGDDTASFLMEVEIPAGIRSNPDDMILGDQTVNVPATYEGYWLGWTAPESGTLTITVTGDNWAFEASNDTQDVYAYHYGCDGAPNTLTWEVAAGDKILLCLLTYDENWDCVGGQLTVTAEFVSSSGGEVTMGDANGDGAINYLDAMLVAQYYVGDITDADLNLNAADVNGDGQVNYLDAMMIAQYYVGDIDSFDSAN